MTRLLVHVWCECEALAAAGRPCPLRLQALRLELHLLETRLPRWVAAGLAADDDAARLQAFVAAMHERLDGAEEDGGRVAQLQDELLLQVLALVGACDEPLVEARFPPPALQRTG